MAIDWYWIISELHHAGYDNLRLGEILGIRPARFTDWRWGRGVPGEEHAQALLALHSGAWIPPPIIPRLYERGRCGWAYVYTLNDPRTGEAFYVGKGNGKRINQHEKEAALGLLTPKGKKIREIQEAGFEVDKRIVALFTKDGAALTHERALIRELPGLTNRR